MAALRAGRVVAQAPLDQVRTKLCRQAVVQPEVPPQAPELPQLPEPWASPRDQRETTLTNLAWPQLKEEVPPLAPVLATTDPADPVVASAVTVYGAAQALVALAVSPVLHIHLWFQTWPWLVAEPLLFQEYPMVPKDLPHPSLYWRSWAVQAPHPPML